ncbi:hypothetical protein ABEQ41_20080 [Priestia megaterium]|uniref:hypothetical protein n=1 Tax=Priestia aryabhattai TaxID=412384 RepID=UPI0027E5336D|nr:hypothetical protein [Priestia aryabhattai]MCG0045537.1 hypothetical protein [Priestia aryabhattai]
MKFKEELPEWNNAGKPPDIKTKTSGWSSINEVSVEYLNWHMNRTFKSLQEIQEKAIYTSDFIEYKDNNNDRIKTMREYLESLEINAKFPPLPLVGIKGDGSDETQALDNIFKYAKAVGVRKVFIPAGKYFVRYLNRYNGLNIRGNGMRATIIVALKSDEQNFVRTAEAPVQLCSMKDMSIFGSDYTNNPNSEPVNLEQNGLVLQGFPSIQAPYHGGNWYSQFENIEIRKFGGYAIGIVAQGQNGKIVNQFLTFKNIYAYRVSTTKSRALYIEGQLGQTRFENVTFDGEKNSVKTPGVNIEVNGGNSLVFDNICSQNSEKILLIKNNLNSLITNSWFENAKYCIEADNVRNLFIFKNNFANTCSDDNGEGFGIKSLNSADSITIEGTGFYGTVDWSIIGNSNTADIQIRDARGVIKTKGITKQRLAVDNLNVGANKLIYLVNDNQTISTLNHKLAPGESFTIKFHGNKKNTTIDDKGNIILPYNTKKLSFRHNDTISFIVGDIEQKLIVNAFVKG